MNEAQFYQLDRGLPKLITLQDLTDKSPRTLVYGYNCNRDTWHIYITADGQFQWVLYDFDGFLIDEYKTDSLKPSDCLPDKRIYGQKSDFEFCQLLMHCGQSLPFTTFTAVEPAQYYGKRREDLLAVRPEAFEVEVELDYETLALPSNYPGIFRLDSYRKQLLVQAAEKAINGQTEGCLRGWFKERPDLDRWLANIPGAVSRAISQELTRYTPELGDNQYQVPFASAEIMVTAARDAVNAKIQQLKAAA